MIKVKIVPIALAIILYATSFIKAVSASSVILNEFMPHPSSGNDWIELYNSTDSMVDLSNWVLVDSTSTMKTLSGTLPASGFTTFDVTNRLNNDGDSIYLKDSSGTSIDSYIYSSDPGIDKTIGRSPDGGNWTILSSASKGSSNGGALIAETSTPTPTPTPFPSPIPTPTATPNPSSFTVSNIPAQINSDQSFSVSVNLSSDNPNVYFKGAFKKADSLNYFGLTKVSGSWIKNGSTYSNQYKASGNFQLEIKPDTEDSGYTGSGDYLFKVAGYSETGDLTWSNNETTIKINNTAISSSTPAPTDDSSVVTSPNPSPLVKSSPRPQTYATSTASIKIASVAAAVAEASPKAVEVKDQKQINPVLWIGLILIFAAIFYIGYIYWKKRCNKL